MTHKWLIKGGLSPSGHRSLALSASMAEPNTHVVRSHVYKMALWPVATGVHVACFFLYNGQRRLQDGFDAGSPINKLVCKSK